MTKILPIITEPAESLRRRSVEVETEQIKNGGLRELCDDMAETMLKKDGVGLAAPQIGRNIRLIVVNTKDGTVCMLNPVVLKKSFLKEWGEEGCLSVPGVFGMVKRPKKIDYCYYDTKGRRISSQASGFMSRVIQHEIDHLDGILFIDKAIKLKKYEKD